MQVQMGKVGSGMSFALTVAAYKALQEGRTVYSNYPVKGGINLDTGAYWSSGTGQNSDNGKMGLQGHARGPDSI